MSAPVSNSAAVRARAARIVAQVAIHGQSLDALFAGETSGSAQERGLLRTLCYDSIRWYVRLDALLQRLLARPGQTLDPELHALAIVGLCQLLYSDVPPHAAVAETVNATRVLRQPRAAGLINAILRRCQREGAKIAVALDADPATRTAHPRWLVDMLARDWPSVSGSAPGHPPVQLPVQPDVASILVANNQRPPFWLRVNRLRVSAADYGERLRAAGLEVIDSRDQGHTLLLARAVDVNELPGFRDGWVSVQDAAAQLAAPLLAPAPGDRILDACAAPGGKTCHLLELQPRVEELVAVDVSKERLTRVCDNLQRLGLAATVVAGDAAEPAGWWDGRAFDRILLDVPCSATGVIRRHPDIKLLRRAQDITALAERQRRLLQRAWSMLKPGGRLVYASCSVLRAETTEVVAAFLRANPEARDTTATDLKALGWSFTEGVPGDAVDSSVSRSLTGQPIAPGTGSIRRASTVDDGELADVTAGGLDGFYYAGLEKNEG